MNGHEPTKRIFMMAGNSRIRERSNITAKIIFEGMLV